MSASPPEVFGPYRVYEQLGIGGMASVHRAEVSGVAGFQRVVALKRMLPHVAANDEMVKAFVREARLASHLRHENVAQTYELGRVGDIYFIAMELVGGRNLREILKHCALTNIGPMPVPIALQILNQICDSLDYAHNLCDETGQPLGIIHRDVTPSNIIVSDGGIVKLIDFGIAKASAAGMQTMGATLKGKFGYMAPEYIAGSIDARADLFALGVIAHELLTNRPLFTGSDDLETLTRVQRMEIQPPSHRNRHVPREIDDIVMTALARDPDARWQHATALRTALGTITQRLGLGTTNSAVTQWIDYAFDQTKPGMMSIGAEHDREVGSLPSIVIAQLGTAELSPEQRFALVTPLTIGRPVPDPDPAATMPSGTPASITAQRSIPPGNSSQPPRNASGSHPVSNSASSSSISITKAISQSHATIQLGSLSGSHPIPAGGVAPPRSVSPAVISGDAYQAAVQRYERHEGLSPGAGLMSEDVLPALVRQSAPRIANLPEPGHGSNPGIALPPPPARLSPPTSPHPVIQTSPHHPTLFDPGSSAAITAERLTAATPARQTPIPPAAPAAPATPAVQAEWPLPHAPAAVASSRGFVLPFVVMLVVAGVVAAVVYFVLPRLA